MCDKSRHGSPNIGDWKRVERKQAALIPRQRSLANWGCWLCASGLIMKWTKVRRSCLLIYLSPGIWKRALFSCERKKRQYVSWYYTLAFRLAKISSLIFLMRNTPTSERMLRLLSMKPQKLWSRGQSKYKQAARSFWEADNEIKQPRGCFSSLRNLHR